MENSKENVYTDVRVQRVRLRRTSQKKGILHTPTTQRLDITQNGLTEWLQTRFFFFFFGREEGVVGCFLKYQYM